MKFNVLIKSLCSTYGSSARRRHLQRLRLKCMLALQGDLPAKISAATMGKLKTCAICGGEGHNKATCPTIPANAARAAAGGRQQRRRCSLCGKLGHRRDVCPEAAVRVRWSALLMRCTRRFSLCFGISGRATCLRAHWPGTTVTLSRSLCICSVSENSGATCGNVLHRWHSVTR